MQIHELDNYAGNLDSNAYAVIDDGSDTGKISVPDLLSDVNQEIANVNARVNNIIAGDAPSAAEVQDARLGAADMGSVPYASVGDAIRGQVTDLRNDIGVFLDFLSPVSSEVGKYVSMSGGLIQKYSVGTCSYAKFDVSAYAGKEILISSTRLANPYTAFAMIGDENDTYLQSIIDANNTQLINAPITLNANAKYLYLNYANDKFIQVAYNETSIFVLGQNAEAFLWSETPIYWNWSGGKIESESSIHIFIPATNYSAVLAAASNDYAAVNCGTSRFLYFDTSTMSLTTSGSVIADQTHLLIGVGVANEINYMPLQRNVQKKCACYGDSITWYDGQVYNWGKFSGDTAVGFETWLRRTFGFVIYNYGASGETSLQICNRVRNANLSAMNYMTLTSGANDERHNVPLGNVLEAGSTFDTSTFCGAFQSAIESALSDNPEMKIILCTPIQGWIYADGYDAADYPDHPNGGDIDPKWANAIKRIAEIYALPVCDWYCESGINLSTRNVYINDPEPDDGNTLYSLHPTPKGYKRMSEILIDTFNKVLPL